MSVYLKCPFLFLGPSWKQIWSWLKWENKNRFQLNWGFASVPVQETGSTAVTASCLIWERAVTCVKGSSSKSNKLKREPTQWPFLIIFSLKFFNRICRIIAKNIRQSSGFFVGTTEASSLAGFKISLLGFFPPTPPAAFSGFQNKEDFLYAQCLFCSLFIKL